MFNHRIWGKRGHIFYSCDGNDNERDCIISIINAKRGWKMLRAPVAFLTHIRQYYWRKIKGIKEDFFGYTFDFFLSFPIYKILL